MNKPSAITKGIFIILMLLIAAFALLPLYLIKQNVTALVDGRQIVGEVMNVQTQITGSCFSEVDCRSDVIKQIKYFDDNGNEQFFTTSAYSSVSFLGLFDEGDKVNLVVINEDFSSIQVYLPFVTWAYIFLLLVIVALAVKGAIAFLHHNKNIQGTQI